MKNSILILIAIIWGITAKVNAQWTNISLPSFQSTVYGSFPDALHGYVAATGSSYLFRTVNGGTSWDSISMGAMVFDVDFISADTGFVIAGTFSQGMLMTTYNGGNSWTSDSLLPGYYGTMIQFIDAQNGYVTTNFSDVLKTTDGGNNWTAVPTGGYCSASDKEEPQGDSIVFTGWDGTFAYQGSVLRSDDNGTSFQELIYAVNYTQFRGSHFLTPSIGFTVHNISWPLNKNYLSKTTNGGVTWDSIIVDTTSTLTFEDVFMISSNEGYIVGSNWPSGSIYHLMGSSISLEETVPTGLKRIYKGGNTVFATGDGGLIMKKQIPLSVPTHVQPLTGIYPNPASNFIHIPLKETSDVSLLDMNGKLIQSGLLSEDQLYLIPPVSPGIYILKVSNSEGISTARIVIQ